MTETVPRLVPRPPTPTLRLLGLVMPGVKAVTEQIEPYTAWWDEQNQRAMKTDGPLLVAIGDSTAIGIGASGPDRSYVGLLHERLRERQDRSWRMVNLGLSGARVDDALDRQLPALAGLSADVVVCCIGTNDVVWSLDTAGLGRRLGQLIDGLPDEAIVGSLAGSSPRGQAANRALRAAADTRQLTVINPWREPGPAGRERLAEDRFHPNDLGYELMANAFSRTLDLESGEG